MSEGTFNRQEFRFDADGLGLSIPQDQPQQQRHFPILVNVRQVVRGTFKQRPGLNSFMTAPAASTPWHSLRRLNDRNANDYTYVAGTGTIVSTGKTGVLTQRDTGYSGNPLTMLPYRPPQSPSEWMAIADSNKMAKVKYDGTLRSLGIPAPTAEPSPELDSDGPLTKVIDNGNSTTNWGNGTGGETPATTVRVNTAIGAGGEKYAGYDVSLIGSTGWYALPLASLANITVGTVLTASGNGATMLVEEIHPSSATSTTVDRVVGEDGATSAVNDWMWITPATALPQLVQHAYVDIGATPYRAAIVDALQGPDGKVSFKIYLPIGTVNAGDAISVENSVYGYLSATPTGNMSATAIQWTALDASSVNALSKTTGVSLDLSVFSSGGRAIKPDDELCLSVYFSDVSRVVEFKVEVDANAGLFTRDYWTRSVAPDEFIVVSTGQVSAQDNKPTERRREEYDRPYKPRGKFYPDDVYPEYSGPREADEPNFPISPGEQPNQGEADPPGSATSRTSTGNAQWATVRFKMSDFKRVGESQHVGLHTIVGMRFWLEVGSSGTLDFAFDDWQIIGGYEPDITEGEPYEYQYRYKDSTTGERSNWSPTSRSKIFPHRYPVSVGLTNSSTTGVDKVEVRRRGGLVNDWRIIGSVSNGSPQSPFQDVYSDNYALGVGQNPDALEGNTNAQPFTLSRGPTNVTGCVVSGPLIKKTSGFNTSLAQGTPVIVNGVPTLIYRVRSADVLEVYDNCGQSSSATVEIPQQFLVGQPLPVIFGPMDGWSFALGDTYNPGRMYFFNYGTLGSTRSSYFIDVTDSAEALLNGCVYNGRAYVWSSERMYVITFSGDDDLFRSDVITSGTGLYARWALAVGDMMYWLGKDGIYSSDGGNVTNIIRRDLLTLFSNEGQTGVSSTSIDAPHMPQNASVAQIAALRLSYSHNKFLYFDYQNSGGDRRTLVLDRAIGNQGEWGWYYDTYAPGATLHYADEGEGVRNVIVCSPEATSAAYTLGGSTKTDNGTAFSCQVRTLSIDGGDLRSEKMFGDGFVDANPGNGSITPTFYFDNLTSNVAGSAITGSARVQPPTIVDFPDSGGASGGGKYARNIALDLAWSVTGNTIDVTLYGWGFSVMGRPERTIKRATDYGDLGHWGPKDLKGLSMEVDTGGVARDLVVEYTRENGTVGTIAKTITTNQKDIIHISWDPVTCYEARIRPTDNDRWRFYETVKWHYEPLTDMTPMAGDWYHFGRAVWVQGVEIDGDTNNVAVSTNIQRDFSEVIRTITATHNGRGTKAYSFDPPFIAYMVRTAPAAAFRRMKEIWQWKPESPIGTVWHAQEMEIGDPLGFIKQFEVEYAAGAAVTLKYYVDGTLVYTNNTTLVTTGNTETFVKRNVILPSKKGRLAYIRLECASGVRVRQNGTVAYGKQTFGDELKRINVIGSTHGYGGDV